MWCYYPGAWDMAVIGLAIAAAGIGLGLRERWQKQPKHNVKEKRRPPTRLRGRVAALGAALLVIFLYASYEDSRFHHGGYDEQKARTRPRRKLVDAPPHLVCGMRSNTNTHIQAAPLLARRLPEVRHDVDVRLIIKAPPDHCADAEGAGLFCLTIAATIDTSKMVC